VGECFFWYRSTRVVPDKRPLNGCCCCCFWYRLTWVVLDKGPLNGRVCVCVCVCYSYYAHFGIAQSVHLSIPWRSCLGYRHAGWLQLSHLQPPQMCGLQTRPWTDVDPPRFLDRTAIDRGHIISPSPGRYLVTAIKQV